MHACIFIMILCDMKIESIALYVRDSVHRVKWPAHTYVRIWYTLYEGYCEG